MAAPNRVVGLRAKLAAAKLAPGEAQRLLAFAVPYRARLAAAMLLLAASTVASLAVPVVLGRLTNQILVDGGDIDAALSQLNRWTYLLIALFGVRAVLSAGHTFLQARSGEGIVVDLRCRLYDHLTSLGPPFFDDRRVGEVVSRLMSDVAQTQSVLTFGAAQLLASTLTIAGAFAILLLRDWQLTVGILVLMPAVVFVSRVYGRSIRKYSMSIQDLAADAASVIEEGFGAIRLVQIFSREPYEQARFRRAAEALYSASIARARLRAVFGPLVGLTTLAALALVLWLGGRQVLAGRIAAGDLVAFVAYAGMIGSAGASLSELYGQWASALGSVRRVFAWLDTAPVVVDGSPGADLPVVSGRLCFHDVWFSYRPDRPVLRGIELSVEPGQTLALVGPTGAGKSTVMHLIARFYDPDSGSVTLDGSDLRFMTLAGLRRWIAVVPQETVLFNATIDENLRYGRLDATDDEVRAAARAAHADEFIDDLPQGYHTLVGERGIRLSAGQRQRVAIARALLKDPRILLLDEATSSLDSESERLVQDALETLLAGRTTVVVAHRLSTVQRADSIAVIEGGRVVAGGRHEDLLREGGLYRRLHDLQFRERPATG